MSKKKGTNFLAQGTILAAAAMITKVVGLAYRIPLTNIMGSEGNGYYGVVFQVYSLALMLTSYSLPMAVSKLVSARVATGQYKNAYRVFQGAMVFALVAGGVVTAIVFFGAGFISTDILKMGMSVYALRVLAPCILIVAFLGVLRGFFQGYGTMIPTAVSQVIEQLINAIVSVVGAYLLMQTGRAMASGEDKEMYGAAFAAAGGTLGTVIGALTALLFLVFVFAAYKTRLKRQMRRDRTRRLESRGQVYKVLLFTIAPVILSATVYNISNIVDQTMFSNIMSAQGMAEREYSSLLGMLNGQYDTMTNIPLSVSSALASSFIPSLVATIQTGNRRQIHSKINMVSRFNMMIAIPCAAGFIALAGPLLDLLYFTQDNAIPALMLRIGGISVVFFCLSTVTNAALQGLDEMGKPVKNAAISLVIHVAALFIMGDLLYPGQQDHIRGVHLYPERPRPAGDLRVCAGAEADLCDPGHRGCDHEYRLSPCTPARGAVHRRDAGHSAGSDRGCGRLRHQPGGAGRHYRGGAACCPQGSHPCHRLQEAASDQGQIPLGCV